MYIRDQMSVKTPLSTLISASFFDYLSFLSMFLLISKWYYNNLGTGVS